MIAGIVALIFGLFSIVGGVMGYKKAHSKASLIAGSISGVLLLIGSLGLLSGDLAYEAMAHMLLLVVSMLLGAYFAVRLLRTRKMMPDLMMILFSAVLLMLLLLHI